MFKKKFMQMQNLSNSLRFMYVITAIFYYRTKYQ